MEDDFIAQNLLVIGYGIGVLYIVTCQSCINQLSDFLSGHHFDLVFVLSFYNQR